MKTIILMEAGGIENLIIKNTEKPVLSENEVLVETKAISINPVDFKLRSSEDGLNRIYGSERPAILGWDISGTVSAVGKQVKQFDVGDNVFGMVNFPGAGKAYAQFVAAPESQLAMMPSKVSYEEAAATTLAALTALQALEGKIKKGDRVLIHAGSGGVGHYAIQIARYMGAYVVTTSSAKNKDFVLGLGANEHIDYQKQAFENVAKEIDFVLDGMGGDILVKSLNVMKAGGIIITLTSPPPFVAEVQKQADKIDVKILPLLVQSNGNDMNKLKEMLESGAIKAHVSARFSFEDIAKAHLYLERGRTVGKVVVTF